MNSVGATREKHAITCLLLRHYTKNLPSSPKKKTPLRYPIKNALGIECSFLFGQSEQANQIPLRAHLDSDTLELLLLLELLEVLPKPSNEVLGIVSLKTSRSLAFESGPYPPG